jgi:hypothetical protein
MNMPIHYDLSFPAPDERYDLDRQAVVFWGRDVETRIRCQISREALDDHFGGDGKDKLAVFRGNRAAIEEVARRQYSRAAQSRMGPFSYALRTY